MRVYFRMTGALVLCLLSIVSGCTRASSSTTEKTVELKPAWRKPSIKISFDASLKTRVDDQFRGHCAAGNGHWKLKYFLKSMALPKDKIPPELYTAFEGLPFDESGPDKGRADATLVGPIKVNGAEPGDVLEVCIRSVQVWLPIAAQSFVPTRGLLTERTSPHEKHRVLFMDLDKQTVEYAPGIVVPLKPFWGLSASHPQ